MMSDMVIPAFIHLRHPQHVVSYISDIIHPVPTPILLSSALIDLMENLLHMTRSNYYPIPSITLCLSSPTSLL